MPPTAGLAALNFFLADVHSGLGPFLATWLATVGWNPERIGLVMTISGLAGLVFNGPAGLLVDRVERPRLWVAVAALAVVAGSMATLPARGFGTVAAAQIAASLGGALMGPALTALTLGVVGKDRFPHQQGRNEAWNHAGNVAAAGLVAVATFAIGAASAFWVLAGMAAGSALALVAIPARAIDSQRASGHATAQPVNAVRPGAVGPPPARTGLRPVAVPPGKRSDAALARPAHRGPRQWRWDALDGCLHHCRAARHGPGRDRRRPGRVSVRPGVAAARGLPGSADPRRHGGSRT